MHPLLTTKKSKLPKEPEKGNGENELGNEEVGRTEEEQTGSELEEA